MKRITKKATRKVNIFFLFFLENEEQKFKTVFLFYNKGHTLKFSNFDALYKNDKKTLRTFKIARSPTTKLKGALQLE